MSVVLAVLIVPVAIRFGHKFDLLDHPGRHKRHKRPVPFVGGAALFVAFWGTMAILQLVLDTPIFDSTMTLCWMFGGAVVIFGIGLLDDIGPLSALTKLTAEAAAGVLLYLGGLTIDPMFIPFLGQFTFGHWSILITILWVIGLTNAINLIDGLDGLASGVSLIAAIIMTALGLIYQAPAVIAVASTLSGFLLVFLWFNRYPARIFLGDSGSLQLGYYFAIISLLVPFKSYTAAALYLPLLALGVPILETAVSILRRLISGKGVMAADRRHLFHYLALAGLSPRQVVLVFWGLSLVFGLSALAMFLWDRVLVSIILGLFMVVIFAAFLIFTANLPRVRKDSPRAGR
jgi:UDP-GlcNAc:undecaprenyl-phosphate GlcNAc-1-phosphate transferase